MATWSVVLKGSYVPYEASVSAAIEAAYQRSEQEALVKICGERYRIIFAPPMKQIAVEDPTRRRNVQRTAPPPAPAPAPAPAAAAASSNDDAEVISLPDDDEDEPATAVTAVKKQRVADADR